MALKFKGSLTLFCILILFILPGCVGLKSLRVGTKINPDCSGKRVIDLALEKKVVASIEKENGTKLEAHLKRKLPARTNIKKHQKNNYIYYTITIPFKKINEVPDQFSGLLKNNGDTHASLTYKDQIFAISYDLKEEINLKKAFMDSIVPESIEPDTGSLDIEYWTQVPGEIRETSGTPVTADTAIWKLKTDKTYKIRTKSLLIRWWLVALTGIALLVLIGSIGVGLIRVKSSREQT